MGRNKHYWGIIAITVALAFAGCNRKVIYHHYEHTPLAGWEKTDTVQFTVSPVKQRYVVQEDVELRISRDYPYLGLNLIVEQTVHPKSVTGEYLRPKAIVRRDTLDCDLIAPDGNIKGDGITLYQYRFPLTDISLNEGDSLIVCIHHNMKRETLPGISDVGLRLTSY